MNFEVLISKMMKLNTMARLWHWMTDKAQHHTTFEQFLTQNETFTDSLVESALGNDIPLDLSKVGVDGAFQQSYSIDSARDVLKAYREEITSAKNALADSEISGSDELDAILDDVVELSSKTLYLLRLN